MVLAGRDGGGEWTRQVSPVKTGSFPLGDRRLFVDTGDIKKYQC
jgi:hypothetical protein